MRRLGALFIVQYFGRAILLLSGGGGGRKIELRRECQRLSLRVEDERRCGGMIPTVRWRLDLGRSLRRVLRGPSLYCGRRGLERVLIEPEAQLVTLLGRFDIAILGRNRKPLVGFGQVLLHADA